MRSSPGMDINIGGQIEKVNGKELTYREFVNRYMEKNLPVVLTGLMDDWRSCKDWVTLNGQPNLQLFSSHFGSSKVQVADCGTREFTDQKREEMRVSDFIRRWLQGSPVQPNTDNHNSNGHASVLYLKDWHFVKLVFKYGQEYPEYLAYNTPVFFHDDWLNLYLDYYKMHIDPDSHQQDNEICCSDYRFVYMGVKGSWTPLHADVFRSYSWSSNVCGKKRWLFLAPPQSHLVFDRNVKNCVYDIFAEVSESTFPGFKKTVWLECTQEAGEIVFVPSGWYHQVHNLVSSGSLSSLLEDTISINHNWFNAYNLSWVWNLLLRDYNEAKEYIEDIKDICDDFEGLCQRNLFANTGMNFYDFFTFITCFTLTNLALLCYLSGKCGSPTESSLTITQHIVFNLGSVRKVALEMKSMHALEGNHDCFLDIVKTSEDPRFSKLCARLKRTYVTIHEKLYLCSEFEESAADYLMGLNVLKARSSSRINTPEGLIKLIDNAVSELGDNYTQQLPAVHLS